MDAILEFTSLYNITPKVTSKINQLSSQMCPHTWRSYLNVEELPLTNTDSDQNIQDGGLQGGVSQLLGYKIWQIYLSSNAVEVKSYREPWFCFHVNAMDDISVRKRQLEDKLAQVFPLRASSEQSQLQLSSPAACISAYLNPRVG